MLRARDLGATEVMTAPRAGGSDRGQHPVHAAGGKSKAGQTPRGQHRWPLRDPARWRSRRGSVPGGSDATTDRERRGEYAARSFRSFPRRPGAYPRRQCPPAPLSRFPPYGGCTSRKDRRRHPQKCDWPDRSCWSRSLRGRRSRESPFPARQPQLVDPPPARSPTRADPGECRCSSPPVHTPPSIRSRTAARASAASSPAPHGRTGTTPPQPPRPQSMIADSGLARGIWRVNCPSAASTPRRSLRRPGQG